MPIYKSIRIEEPVYRSFIVLQQPRETYSQLIQRLVTFYKTVSSAVKWSPPQPPESDRKGE